MPINYLRAETNKYAVGGKVNKNDILKIAEHFKVFMREVIRSSRQLNRGYIDENRLALSYRISHSITV